MIFHLENPFATSISWQRKNGKKLEEKLRKRKKKGEGPVPSYSARAREVKGKEANPEDEKIRVTVM